VTGLAPQPGAYVLRRSDGAGDVVLDVARIAKDELRLFEIAIVNRDTAPSLLSHLNRAYGDAKDAVAQLTAERDATEAAMCDAKDDAVLEMTDEVVATKGFKKSSKEIRDALISSDPRVRLLRDRLLEVRSVLHFVQGKADKFYQAMQSVRALTGRFDPRPEGRIGGPVPAAFTGSGGVSVDQLPDDDFTIPAPRFR
jgi:hypothetical protein